MTYLFLIIRKVQIYITVMHLTILKWPIRHLSLRPVWPEASLNWETWDGEESRPMPLCPPSTPKLRVSSVQCHVRSGDVVSISAGGHVCQALKQWCQAWDLHSQSSSHSPGALLKTFMSAEARGCPVRASLWHEHCTGSFNSRPGVGSFLGGQIRLVMRRKVTRSDAILVRSSRPMWLWPAAPAPVLTTWVTDVSPSLTKWWVQRIIKYIDLESIGLSLGLHYSNSALQTFQCNFVW